ncbi:5'-deoxynucleotidase HDDC2-like [Gavia stellata]|uniref:5'-deoxynucleotidase HDDC2-like n=1 Tax=Gavia stellata TaxID=37040 RepID=UPI00289B661F|nr:5'-deoxynucleotidase HDDC2-like [Gavia stellata]
MAAGASGGGLLPFLRLLGQLKRVPRTGWVYRNVAKPESVSDHMYRMAMMALVTEDKSLNKDRCIRLALVHDMAECIVGDIAPADNISKEEKHRREEAAMQQLTQLLSEDLRKEIYELWEEYENQCTAEAKFVRLSSSVQTTIKRPLRSLGSRSTHEPALKSPSPPVQPSPTQLMMSKSH